MFQHDRQVVSRFDDNEALYLRYRGEHFVEGQLAPAGISFPKTSVNRGSLSLPEDVLFSETGKYNGLGVIELAVADIPPEISQKTGPSYVFFVRHVPEPDNYSHSEI
jgi:hypothetical protein